MDKDELKEVNKLSEKIDSMHDTSLKFYRDPYSIKIRIDQMADNYGNGKNSFEITESTPQVKEVIRIFYRDVKKAILFDLETKKIKFGKI